MFLNEKVTPFFLLILLLNEKRLCFLNCAGVPQRCYRYLKIHVMHANGRFFICSCRYLFTWFCFFVPDPPDQTKKYKEHATYSFIKIHVRRAAAEDILKFTCICVCVCIYLFIYVFVSRLLATLTTIQTWNFAHILPLTLSKNGFFVFSIKSPWRPLALKNCRVTWIFRISPRLPCIFCFVYYQNCVFFICEKLSTL